MKMEIERKFLVKSKKFIEFATNSHNIIQGYIVKEKDRVVRIRITDNQAFITIKGETIGIKRFEWEKEIQIDEANDLLKLCKDGKIEKTRYIIPCEHNLYFEVDVFHKKHEGLIIAEIELPTEKKNFDKPEWLGEEVSDNPKYFNSNLV